VVEYNTSTNPTFEGAVRDTSGRGLDGVMRFGATYDATKKSLEFPLNPATSSNSGNRDSIETGPTLDGTQLVKGYSVSTWFRADSQAAWEQVWVLGKTGLGKHEGLWLSGSSTVSIHNDAGGGLNYYYPCTSGGNWKHVTFVRKGTTASDHDVYVDGVKVTASTTTGGANVHAFEKDSNLILGENIDRNHYGLDGAISNFKLYDTALTAEEVKTLYDMGRCDEGHHVVNFSKTRVGIGLGDGEAPRGVLEIRGNVGIGGQPTYAVDGNAYPDEFPACPLHIHQASHPGMVESEGIRFSHPANIGRWNLFISDNNHFRFVYNGAAIGYVDQNDANAQMNFTGQHRTFIKNVPFSQVGELEGLIVSSDQNKYIKMSGGIEVGSNAITTNESLPVVSLSNVATDKKCFGVISASEDPEERSDAFGSFVTPYEKEKGDTRVYINSVGEGAIWVSNIGGNLEAGDYITTSNVAGYGQKQDGAGLMNYTVAKITMDCDFEPVTQSIQHIKKDETGENILDEHGQIQWEDHATETEKAYKIRYLDVSGAQTDSANVVHIAAFVGCTYHCG
jgi:hypothetical protein